MAAQNVPRVFPHLERELPLPKYVLKKHNGPYMWLAPKGHYEFMHMDPDDNFLIILEGQKRVKLFSPSPVSRMYPNPLGSKGKTIQSRVILGENNEEKYPQFSEEGMIEVTVNAGEMLFIPAFFWHQVTTTTNTLSVNIFFGDDGENDFLEKIMKFPQWDGFSYWLLNILEQNRKLAIFPEILRDLPFSLTQFLIKQLHETPSAKQLERLVALVRERFAEDFMKHKAIISCPASTFPKRKHARQIKIRGLKWRG
eukprot:CAMPEP_0197533712 /NCGR_PEP_ID=MMETSP1318-20131121/44436_1 /TAXON_ID=552666 /ORGANISM="Partenskyella glossopodia, Strain RCC365" /LENGTH=253 /DNA_ID=CAMNT_0043090697 /DNA_START=62 /DNA_END=823 /DNA_ORIENTATION=-